MKKGTIIALIALAASAAVYAGVQQRQSASNSTCCGTGTCSDPDTCDEPCPPGCCK